MDILITSIIIGLFWITPAVLAMIDDVRLLYENKESLEKDDEEQQKE